MSTDAELELRRLIHNQDLARSLEWIRAAVLRTLDRQDQGAGAAARAERRIQMIAATLQALLQSNPGLNLTSREAFLLLAALDLNELGEQADAAHPASVLNQARLFATRYHSPGAAAPGSSARPSTPARDREARPFLSEAWLLYGRQGHDVDLRLDSRVINDQLVDDVRTICRFSHDLDLNRCRPTLRHYVTERCRLLAALLKLARGLSGIGSDLGIEPPPDLTVAADRRLFQLCAERAIVTIAPGGRIGISVPLNAADEAAHHSAVQRVFIRPLTTRLEAILIVLRVERMRLELDGSRAVVRDDHFRPLALTGTPPTTAPSAGAVNRPVGSPRPQAAAPIAVRPASPPATGGGCINVLGVAILLLVFVGLYGWASGWFSGGNAGAGGRPLSPVTQPDPETAVSDYFGMLREQRYAEAWDRLTVDEQQRDYGSYDAFHSIWSDVTDLKIQVNGSVNAESGQVVVEIGQRYSVTSQGKTCEDPHIRIVLHYDPNRGLWLIDDGPRPGC